MEWLYAFAAALFSMMNPIGNTGIFSSLTANKSSSERRKIIQSCMLAIIIILLISTWLGAIALNLLGINLHELRTAGGIIVLLIGLRMLFNDTSHAQTKKEAKDAENQDSIAIVPLAIPLIAGPGVISLIIATANQHTTTTDRLYITIICIIITLATGLVFSFSKKISAYLGENGMAVMTRIMGMVLCTIAIGMLAQGIKGLFPEIFTP